MRTQRRQPSLPKPLIVPDPFDASGCFETCRVKKGKVLHLAQHRERLKTSLKTLHITSVSDAEIAAALQTAARAVGDGFVRVALRRTGDPKVVVHQHRGIPYSARQIRRGIAVTTVVTRQSPVESVPAQVKHSERLSSVLSRAEAGNSMEALRLGAHGYLTEGTVSNLFMVKDAALVTPPSWLGVLEGVTRSQVLQAAGHLKIPVQEVPVTRHDLFNADEAFLTNVLMGIMPIRQVDGRTIGTGVPGVITRRLMRVLSREKK